MFINVDSPLRTEKNVLLTELALLRQDWADLADSSATSWQKFGYDAHFPAPKLRTKGSKDTRRTAE